MIRAFPRGADKDGNKVTVQENLAQMHAFLDELTSMRERCESLEQSDRGAARLRGFVSQDLFKLVCITVASFDDIVHFVSVANGFSLDKFRTTPPYSAVNETSHAMLRAISKNLLISAVARGTGQVLQASLIVSDMARTWIWTTAMSTYESAFEQSPQIRSEAIARFKASNERAYNLKRGSFGSSSVQSRRIAAAELAVLKPFVERTNARLQTMRLSFRDVVVKKEKFGRPDAVRRSVLARSMVDPSILLNPKLKGLPRAFEARRVFLVDGVHAAKLECGLTQAVAIFRPKPKDGTIQLEIKFVKQNTVILSAPVKNVFAAVMDLSDGARPSDNNGVVNVSFVIASCSKAQVLSMLVRKSDQNVCRMLVNLPILKTQLLGPRHCDPQRN